MIPPILKSRFHIFVFKICLVVKIKCSHFDHPIFKKTVKVKQKVLLSTFMCSINLLVKRLFPLIFIVCVNKHLSWCSSSVIISLLLQFAGLHGTTETIPVEPGTGSSWLTCGRNILDKSVTSLWPLRLLPRAQASQHPSQGISTRKLLDKKYAIHHKNTKLILFIILLSTLL